MKTISDAYNLLVQSPSLIIENKNDNIVVNNIQTLYLYPLTIFDYIDNLGNQDIIKLTFLSLDVDADYETFISKLKKLKNVEFIIDSSYIDKIDILKKIINILYEKNIKISLTINNLLEIKDMLIECYEKISYFKIYMLHIINRGKEKEFYKYLELISNKSRGFIHIKTYLNLDEYIYYEDTVKKLNKFNVGIFQVSKELQPLDEGNIYIEAKVRKYIRMLEEKYNKYNTKFISVRDLLTLYYPRFELDERNKRRCYACLMKPYIDGKYIIPCKVNEILNNKDKYGININKLEEYRSKVSDIGSGCSDCASIFENDTLGMVNELLKDDSFRMELI